MPRLITPTLAQHEAFLTAHREWGEGLHEDGFGITPGDDVISPEGFAVWLTQLHERPATSWWIVDDSPTDLAGSAGEGGGDAMPRILGAIALRPTELSGDLVTGHIGYGVTPSARGRGIATWALTTALSEAASRGMPMCVLVCLDDNVASIRTIERCGGRLESMVTDDDGVRRRIYRIDVAPPTTDAGQTTDDAQHDDGRGENSR